MSSPEEEMTQLLESVSAGRASPEDLVPGACDRFEEIARIRLAQLKPGETLQATALVHEAYLKLTAGSDQSWESRTQFCSSAARAMRKILVDELRAKNALKRPIGFPCGGSIRPGLRSVGSGTISSAYSYLVSGAVANRAAFMLIGFRRETWSSIVLSFEMSLFGIDDCYLRTSMDLIVPLQARASTTSFPLPSPNDARLIGLELNTQAAVADPSADGAGLAMSNSLVTMIQQSSSPGRSGALQLIEAEDDRDADGTDGEADARDHLVAVVAIEEVFVKVE